MMYFVLGMFFMWLILSLIITLGDEFFHQDCLWENWFIFIVCFPMLVFCHIPQLIIDKIKKKRK